jgi:trigger factor
MNHTIETLSDTRVKVTVTVSADEVTGHEREALRDVSAQARVPGFRPGKAPEELIRRRFAKAIAEETTRRCVSAAYEYAKDKPEQKVYTLIDAPDASFAPGVETVQSFTFDLMPKVELPTYFGVETKVKPVVIKDEEVDAEVENLRKSRASYNPVERAAKAGDYVKVSYKGTIDGADIAGMTDKKIWGTQENTWEEAGEAGPNTLGVPAVVEGVIGLAAGESKDVEQTFEENHEAEALRGKKGTYHLTVHEVRERVLPELNDEFFKGVKAENLDDLKSKIRTEMTNRLSYNRHMAQREQITRFLLESCQFEVPQSAIDGEKREVIERIMMENMQRGVPREEFENHKEELDKSAQEIALIQCRRNFILVDIATKEKVEATPDDFNRAITLQAMQMRVKPADLVKELTKDKSNFRRMQRDIVLDKTMELLAEKATVVESDDAEESHEGHDHA